jgi:predicted alpha/beta superfamily hydrolase
MPVSPIATEVPEQRDEQQEGLGGEMVKTELYSEEIGDTFVIDVSLPEGYETNPQKRYPVLYLTDGNWRRGQHETIHAMSVNGEIEELIIVGISYPDSYNVNQIRERDLITGADEFLDFIVDDVIPYVDGQYRTDEDRRTLWGSSWGGYFALYAMSSYKEKTEGVFENYISVSPTFWRETGGQDLFAREEDLYRLTEALPIGLYMAVGALEDDFIDPFNRFVAQIEQRDYAGLHFEHSIVPGLDHYTVAEPELYNALRLFYGR